MNNALMERGIAVFSLTLKRLIRSNKRWTVLFVTVAASAAVVTSLFNLEDASTEAAYGSIRAPFFYLLVLFLGYLLFSGIFADEVEKRTFPYLLSRCDASRFSRWG